MNLIFAWFLWCNCIALRHNNATILSWWITDLLYWLLLFQIQLWSLSTDGIVFKLAVSNWCKLYTETFKLPITRLADIFLVRVLGGQFFCLVIWKIMSPKFLLIAHVYFTDQKYRKTVISHYMTTCSPDDSYFRVTMKLLMAQSHNTAFLNASSVKVQDIMLTSTHLPYIFFLS